MEETTKKKKQKQLKVWMAVLFAALFIGLMFFLFAGDNRAVLKALFQEDVTKDEARDALSRLGVRGYITVGILSMLQVVFTFLPAEPVQVIAGISFGLWKGVLVCLAGVILGNSLIYLMYKLYGKKLDDYIEYNAEFDFEAARRSRKISLIIFILYFLPAIPYGLICFFTASLGVKYRKFILLTGCGSIPSILIGVALGHVAMASSWIISVIVFLALVALLVTLVLNRDKVFKRINQYVKERNANAPKKPNRVLLAILGTASRMVFSTKIKIRLKNNVGLLEKPSIVLCNHGSFIDFVFAGCILLKNRPNIVSARLYFYHKKLGWLMRKLGCLPKSMFASDLENVKACMRVLATDGVLAMMPEARLSTVGKFEGVQDSTYKFIQRANVAVYTIKLNGAYLAKPKWGNGTRRGGLVEGELNPLFAAGETKDMPLEEMQRRIEEVLYYDEFEWLKTKPELTYKSRTLAEGLENILYLCPKCGAKHSIVTRKKKVSCECCGMQMELDNRYGFTDTARFENFAQWYAWQAEETKREILQNPDYALEGKVELRHSSIDGKHLTRRAGEGVCRLNKEGLTYIGTRDGEEIEKFFPQSQIYRLLFGAGEDFEIYEGREIWYFVPEERRSCVTWYVVSGLLKEVYGE